MKYLFLILGLIICFARGLYADDGEAQRITESVMSTMGGDLRVEYDVLIEKVRAINPNIIENLEALDLSEDGKISVLRSYLAHESFNYYKNKFLSDLKERAQETAREIKSDDWQTVDKNFEITENTYWLDRGELDTKKCRSDEGFMVCQYPDGFEEFSVRIRETVSVNMADTTYSTQELVLTKDVPSEDYSLRCSITLNIKKMKLILVRQMLSIQKICIRHICMFFVLQKNTRNIMPGEIKRFLMWWLENMMLLVSQKCQKAVLLENMYMKRA